MDQQTFCHYFEPQKVKPKHKDIHTHTLDTYTKKESIHTHGGGHITLTDTAPQFPTCTASHALASLVPYSFPKVLRNYKD